MIKHLVSRSTGALIGLIFFFSLAWVTGLAQGQSFDNDSYKFFDATLNAPMDTVSGITELSRDINYVYGVTTVVTVIIFFFVAIPLCYTIYKFRAKSGDKTIPKQVHGHTTLEILWTVIPTVLLILIAIPTWKILFRHAEVPENALKIQVIGHQWWWEFRYPDAKITTANEVHLPAGTSVVFEITSADVLHSFWVPKFGSKVDAQPGVRNYLSVKIPELMNKEATVGGEYYMGQCVELCGSSHALMRFHAVVHSKEEFAKWTKSYNQPPVLATQLEKEGEKVFAKCMACHTISGTPSADLKVDKIGPDLTNFGSRKYLGAGTRRNSRENLAAWIQDPPKIKPGALMPNLGLTDDEITKVSAYIRYSTAKSL